MEALKIPYRKCKFCKHFDDTEKRAYNCYCKPICPATEVKLVVEDKVSKVVNAIIDARLNKDLAFEIKCLTLVSKQSDAFKQRFWELLERKQSETSN